MATAKRGKSTRGGTRPRYRRIALFVLVAFVALAAFSWSALSERATAAAAYGARVTCSCHYVAGRSLEDCEKDMLPGMEMVMLDADEEAKRVTASVPLLASQSATWREGPGCVLEPWED